VVSSVLKLWSELIIACAMLTIMTVMMMMDHHAYQVRIFEITDTEVIS
jgi:hypothetical protein